MDTLSRDLLNADELLGNLVTPTSRLKRLANFLLDLVFFYIIVFTIGLIVMLIYPEIGYSFEPINPLVDRLIGTLFYSTYYVIFKTWLGKTLGKIITKTKVVNKQGQKPDFSTVLVRNLVRAIPLDAFTFLRENPIGMHDRMSNTMVIDDRPLLTLDQSLHIIPD
ncbi:RDD family protein [Spirosoma sp. HMF3257]|uniref:RDD family protein n=1 Tax=Spirosoma telluris TaxID=2183553 RepID=A0A327NKT4_9BACT|nr:RDD family protein [Spirosoma telluris]RAI74524.1 RDD family protein [Spirosoma telluris]